MMEPSIEETPRDSAETIPVKGKFQFSIRTLLWIMAVVCAGLGLGHAIGQSAQDERLGQIYGISFVAITLFAHWLIWLSRFSFWEYVVVGIVISVLCALLVPAVCTGGWNPAFASVNQVKQLSAATLCYQAGRNEFPPAFTHDETGSRLHSWRTLLLPYLDKQTLYQSLDRKKPWDNPDNLKYFKEANMPWMGSPRNPRQKESKGATNYFAVVDEETVWDPTAPVNTADIKDSLAQTIVLIEVLGREIPWYEPRDLTLEEAVDVLVGEGDIESVHSGFFVSKRIKGDGLQGRIVGFADGHVEVLYPIANRATARALLTCSGGEVLPTDLGQIIRDKPPVVIGYIIHWGRISSVLLFVVLILLPFWRRRVVSAGSSQELCHG